MTELETMQHVKMYMDKLAQGIDPISNLEMPKDSLLNDVRIARCFFYVSGILNELISRQEQAANTTSAGKTHLPAFEISPAQVLAVPISAEPIRITQLVDRINSVVNNDRRKKLRVVTITNWLLSKGFLTNVPMENGKNKRVPTEAGERLGLSTELRQGQHGEYLAVTYSTSAQHFVLDHLVAMLGEQ